MTEAPRKGARRMAEIPPEVLQDISTGRIPTVNLVEFLAADLGQLLASAAAQIGIDPQHPALLKVTSDLPALKPMRRHWAIAATLRDVIAQDQAAEAKLAAHPSDIARQWAALMIGLRPDEALAWRLQRIRSFAADLHFGVREIAWMAVRDAVAAEVSQALALLQPWALASDPNLRRFASEVTRPRGVWCAHLELLKRDPQAGYPLLHPLRADPSRYVQNSVANWINDAAKSRPDWARQVCEAWGTESASRATAYICKRALRSLNTA